MFRYRFLDFSRGVAALVIAVLHWNVFMIEAAWGDHAAGGLVAPLAGLLQPIYVHGEYGVQYFWILSGFIFAHVYVDTQTGFRTFALRRFARLYPLHFATLLLVAGLQVVFMTMVGTTLFYGSNDAYHFLLHLFFVPSLGLEETLSFNGPVWSVAVELPIYLLFWFYARTLTSSAALALGVAALFFVSQSVLAIGKLGLCGLFFFIGVAAFHVARNLPALPLAYISALSWTGSVAALVLLPALRGVETLLLVLAFVPLLTLLSALDRLSGARYRAADRAAAFGDLSYSIYLLHVPVLMFMTIAMIGLGIDRDLLSGALWPMLLYLGLVLGLSRLSLLWFETPARAWLRDTLAPVRQMSSSST